MGSPENMICENFDFLFLGGGGGGGVSKNIDCYFDVQFQFCVL